MKLLGMAVGQTVLAMSILLISHNAYAQYGWCCRDVVHAGSTDAERCENNMITFAKSSECEAHKHKHDQQYGHDSTCSAGMGALPMLPAVAVTDLAPMTPGNVNGTTTNSP